MNGIGQQARLLAALAIGLCLFSRAPVAIALEGMPGNDVPPAASNIPEKLAGPKNYAAMAKPPQRSEKGASLPASFASSKISRLPDGNVEFCAGPGHE